MKAPKCRICGVEEWRHVCGAVANAVANKEWVKRRPGVYRDMKKRTAYQRVLMQLRRALESGRACPWPQ